MPGDIKNEIRKSLALSMAKIGTIPDITPLNDREIIDMVNKLFERKEHKYDPEGKLTEKWYITEKGNCRELYDKGVITQKTCEDRSIKETTVSYYKDGKLVETKKL